MARDVPLKICTFRLSNLLMKYLIDQAKRRNSTVSEVIRGAIASEAINQYPGSRLEFHQSLLECHRYS